tara:strand:+ start:13285 stop:14676 length:1392 start_codon:yes stop_codon:yes gene_type:complete
LKSNLLKSNHYHFIGIGGIGMSAIAIALLKKGFSVSGSDVVKNEQTLKIKEMGATLFERQEYKNIDTIQRKYKNKEIIIVKSSAIKKDNQELSYSNKKKLSVKHRSEILSSIMQSYLSIGIAGSHGKTSTSTFLSTLLDLCTKDSSSIVGGVHPIYNSNSHIDETKYIVAEIDESDGSTGNYKSDLGVITNIDFDHCDYYSNINEIINTFKNFALNSNKLLINYDCKISRNNIFSSYKWSIKEIKNIDYAMIPQELNESNTIADYFEQGNFLDTFNIPIPGLHNLSNITAAISACRLNNISLKEIKSNIKYLKLPKRRFELRGKFNNRKIIDDYAHHPNEIKATIELAKLFLKENSNLIIVFQPHRFSRVERFLNEFADALAKANSIIITNIYGAGESNINNINSKILTNEIYKINQNVLYLKDNFEVKKFFNKITKPNDLILNMGAGDCNNLWSILQDDFKK